MMTDGLLFNSAQDGRLHLIAVILKVLAVFWVVFSSWYLGKQTLITIVLQFDEALYVLL